MYHYSGSSICTISLTVSDNTLMCTIRQLISTIHRVYKLNTQYCMYIRASNGEVLLKEQHTCTLLLAAGSESALLHYTL